MSYRSRIGVATLLCGSGEGGNGGLVVWVDGRMEGWYFIEFFPPIAYIRMYVVFVGIFFSFFVLLL